MRSFPLVQYLRVQLICVLLVKARAKVLKFSSLFSSAYALFHFPYPLSPLLATLTKTAGVCTNSSHIGTRNPLRAALTSILQALTPSLSHSCALFSFFLTQRRAPTPVYSVACALFAVTMGVVLVSLTKFRRSYLTFPGPDSFSRR